MTNLYTSFRIHIETKARLEKLKAALGMDSMEATLKWLIEQEEVKLGNRRA